MASYSFKNHNPRKGTETLGNGNRFLKKRTGIKNHNPRKGTETVLYSIACHPLVILIKKHNPRKGTETFHIPYIHNLAFLKH